MSETQALVKLDPQSLLLKAVEGSASVETIERLVALAKDVREVQAREAWHRAMAEFQRRCPPIKKDSTAEVATARGYYRYNYAQLGNIMEAIRELLGELGLSVTWNSRVEPGRVIVSCRVAHALGHSEQSGEVSMPVAADSDRAGGNAAQKVGSALTYARRYSLLCITGLCPEDDDDARAAGEKKPATPAEPAPSPEKETPPVEPDPEPDIMAALVSEWYQALATAETEEKLKSLWKNVTHIRVWSGIGNEDRVKLQMAKDRRKTELSQVGSQPGLLQ